MFAQGRHEQLETEARVHDSKMADGKANWAPAKAKNRETTKKRRTRRENGEQIGCEKKELVKLFCQSINHSSIHPIMTHSGGICIGQVVFSLLLFRQRKTDRGNTHDCNTDLGEDA